MSRNRSNGGVSFAADLFWSRSLAKWVLIASVSRRRNSAFCWVSTLAARGSPVMKTEAAERGSPEPRRTPFRHLGGVRRKFDSPFEVLRCKRGYVALDNVASALQIERKGQYDFKATMFVVGHTVGVETGHILLDLAVERVENVVQAAGPRQASRSRRRKASATPSIVDRARRPYAGPP